MSSERKASDLAIRADQREVLHGTALDCLSGIGSTGSLPLMNSAGADALRHLLGELGDGHQDDGEIAISMHAEELRTALEVLRSYADRQARSPHVELVEETCDQLLAEIPKPKDGTSDPDRPSASGTTRGDQTPPGGGGVESDIG